VVVGSSSSSSDSTTYSAISSTATSTSRERGSTSHSAHGSSCARTAGRPDPSAKKSATHRAATAGVGTQSSDVSTHHTPPMTVRLPVVAFADGPSDGATNATAAACADWFARQSCVARRPLARFDGICCGNPMPSDMSAVSRAGAAGRGGARAGCT